MVSKHPHISTVPVGIYWYHMCTSLTSKHTGLSAAVTVMPAPGEQLEECFSFFKTEVSVDLFN